MIARSIFTFAAALALFTTSSLSAPTASPEAHSHLEKHKLARYARSYIYERRQIPDQPTSTSNEGDASSMHYYSGHKDHYYSHSPHWSSSSGTGHNPQPSSGFSLPPIPMNERRDAPYSYFSKRDAAPAPQSGFSYPYHGNEKHFGLGRGACQWQNCPSSPSPDRAGSPSMPQPSSGFHLPGWGHGGSHHGHHGPYHYGGFGGAHQHGSDSPGAADSMLEARSVKAPTRAQAAGGEVPRYAMGY